MLALFSIMFFSVIYLRAAYGIFDKESATAVITKSESVLRLIRSNAYRHITLRIRYKALRKIFKGLAVAF